MKKVYVMATQLLMSSEDITPSWSISRAFLQLCIPSLIPLHPFSNLPHFSLISSFVRGNISIMAAILNVVQAFYLSSK